MKLPGRLVAASASLMMAAATMTLAAPRALADTDTDIVAIVVQPVTTQVNTAMTPAVVVHVEEPDGTLDPDYNGPVTLTYAVNQIGAPEPANNTVTAVSGVAVFPDLIFSAVGFGFELQATVPMATSPPSQPFDIVDQLLQCQHGQACQSETVSSAGPRVRQSRARRPAATCWPPPAADSRCCPAHRSAVWSRSRSRTVPRSSRSCSRSRSCTRRPGRA